MITVATHVGSYQVLVHEEQYRPRIMVESLAVSFQQLLAHHIDTATQASTLWCLARGPILFLEA